ncbi:Enoyl-CoA hydratase [Stutzerimonas xanthomarina]|nr:Enoyl-CoA hydratase [Stutzerimonas xanthomarina]
MSVPILKELISALTALDADDKVHAVILTGSGRCFSAGVDLKEQLAALEADTPGPASVGAELYTALLYSTKPIIVAINGPALGAGLGIAASCCILVASEKARVGIPEVDVGMLGGARHALRLLGHSTVNRMLLAGHQLDARELYHRRVIEACLPEDELMPYARKIAEEIADKDPTAVQMARRSLAEVEELGVLEGYRLEMELASELGMTENARNSMRAFLK